MNKEQIDFNEIIKKQLEKHITDTAHIRTRIKRNKDMLARELDDIGSDAKWWLNSAGINGGPFEDGNDLREFQYNLAKLQHRKIANSINVYTPSFQFYSARTSKADEKIQKYYNKNFMNPNPYLKSHIYNAYSELTAHGVGVLHQENKKNYLPNNKTEQHIAVEHLDADRCVFNISHLSRYKPLTFFAYFDGDDKKEDEAKGWGYFLHEHKGKRAVFFFKFENKRVESFLKYNPQTDSYLTKIPVSISFGNKMRLSNYTQDATGYIDDVYILQRTLDQKLLKLSQYNDKQPVATWIMPYLGTDEKDDKYSYNNKNGQATLKYHPTDGANSLSRPELVGAIAPPTSLTDEIKDIIEAIISYAGADALQNVIQQMTSGTISGVTIMRLIKESDKQNNQYLNNFNNSLKEVANIFIDYARCLHKNFTFQSNYDIDVQMVENQEIKNQQDYDKIKDLYTLFNPTMQDDADRIESYHQAMIDVSGIEGMNQISKKSAKPSEIETIKQSIMTLTQSLEQLQQAPQGGGNELLSPDEQQKLVQENIRLAQDNASLKIDIKNNDTKYMLESENLELKKEQLMQNQEKIDIDKAKAGADVQHKDAQTTKVKVETNKSIQGGV